MSFQSWWLNSIQSIQLFFDVEEPPASTEMGFLFSRPAVATRHPSIVNPEAFVGLPLTTVLATLRTRGLTVTPVAVKPGEEYEPGSARVPAGTLLVIYNCENYYVTEVIGPGRRPWC